VNNKATFLTIRYVRRLGSLRWLQVVLKLNAPRSRLTLRFAKIIAAIMAIFRSPSIQLAVPAHIKAAATISCGIDVITTTDLICQGGQWK
jgi:hypothetical protein